MHIGQPIEVNMILYNIQNFSTRNNYTFFKKNSTYTNKQLAQDKVSFTGNREPQQDELYTTVKQAREGNEESIAILSKAMALAKETKGDWSKIFSSSETPIIKGIAYQLSMSKCDESKFDVYNYPRIYRAIGSSEYEALMKGQRITSELRNYRGVDVTNNINYGNACTEGDKTYLITFKLKENLDAFLSQLPGQHRSNGTSYVWLKNTQTSEFILEGGYTLDDVENITEYSDEFPDGKMIFGTPTKKIKIELDRETKTPDAKIETPSTDDGINDIHTEGPNPSNTDLDGASDSGSFQEFLRRENEESAKQNIDLPEADLPKPEVPVVPDLKLEKPDIADNVGQLSENVDKAAKSSKTFKPILLLLGIFAAIAGTIYYISEKNKKSNKNLDKQV